MSIFGLPLIMYQVPSAVDMGDLEFIQTKVLAGDYFQVSGAINVVNDTIEFIVPNLKTAFLIEAKITIPLNPTISITIGGGGRTDMVTADLKIDGAIKSKAQIGVSGQAAISAGDDAGGGAGFGTQSESRFNVLGLSLVGNGVKVIEIENVIDDGSAFAEMSGYLIDT